ncbi:MAG: VIT and VWA domain-containing protein [Chromatiaceae bacterium]|nr:VIT and VWA domain-containing protein [Chromatiaceae bacterium]
MSAAAAQQGLWNRRASKPIPLVKTELDAELVDLCARVTLRQRYVNHESSVIEAVYSFPLPVEATLLSLQVQIGERILTGRIQERTKARESYEDAVTDGHTAVLLEKLEEGIYSLSLGNLGPGEAAEISLRFAQLLSFDGPRVRWSLPTVIAPRYGKSPHASDQTPEAKVDVEHPLQTSVSVRGLLRPSRISSPSHELQVAHMAEQALVELPQAAWLDRDLVLTFDLPNGERVGAIADRDLDQGATVLASFCPSFSMSAEDAERGRAVTLLIDCSGSMAGASISQARQALESILETLRPQDRIALVRFGSHIDDPRAKHIGADDPEFEQLHAEVQALAADLGGTNLFHALRHALELAPEDLPTDLLLITDGKVWSRGGQLEAIKEKAAERGQRIFTVGVGSAVAEQTVQALADGTGGACVLASPGEQMARVIQRQFERMFAARALQVEVNWPMPPRWEQTPGVVFSNDTLNLFARLPEMADGEVQLRLRLAGGETLSQKASILPLQSSTSADTPSDLARLGAEAQLRTLLQPDKRVDVALRYQLISKETACSVVDTAAVQGDGLPVLRKVPTMRAAGTYGSSIAGPSNQTAAASMYVMRCNSTTVSSVLLQDRTDSEQDDLDGLDTNRRYRANRADEPADFPALAINRRVFLVLNLMGQGKAIKFPNTLIALSVFGLQNPGFDALLSLLDEGWDEAAVVAVYLSKLLEHAETQAELNRQASRRIRVQVKTLPSSIDLATLSAKIDEALSRFTASKTPL